MVGTAGGWHSHLAILTDKASSRTLPAFCDVFRSVDGQYEKRIPR